MLDHFVYWNKKKGTTIEYPAINSIEQHGKLGVTLQND